MKNFVECADLLDVNFSLMLVLIFSLFATVPYGYCAVNCADGTEYPYEDESQSSYTTGGFQAVGSIEDVINGVEAFFNVGTIPSLTANSFSQGWVICCDGKEKEWSCNWTNYESTGGSITPSAGPSAAAPFVALVNAVNGYTGWDSSIWTTFVAQVGGLSFNAVSASFSYDADYDAPCVVYDNCAHPEWTGVCDFLGTEIYNLSATGPSYSSPDLEFEMYKGRCRYKKWGFIQGTAWSVKLTIESSVRSTWRIGADGQEHTAHHIGPYSPPDALLATGNITSTSIATYQD